MQKIYYVANARMPNEKAHGIQIAKMCEAFLSLGVDVTLIIPERKTESKTLQEFYGLKCDVPLVKIPTLDLYVLGRIGFAASSFVFMMFVEFYLWFKKLRGETFVVYTVDMDNFSYVFLPWAGKTFTEMHTPKDPSWLQKFFFKKAMGIIATNKLIQKRFIDDYSLSEAKVISEPNGVDYEAFATPVEQTEARKKLLLPLDKKIAVYIGRFYAWKALDILAAAASLSPNILYYVIGGQQEEFVHVTKVSTIPPNLLFVGGKTSQEIPLWLHAADVLLVLGSKKNEDSNQYTSPMKVFEYMASGVPIVASATPSNTDVLSETQAFLYEPDNAESLSKTIQLAIKSPKAHELAREAQWKVQNYTWTKRAERILGFMKEV